MTRTIERFTPRHALLAAFAAAACLSLSGLAQAQSTSQGTAGDASRMNAPNTQGVASGTDAARTGSEAARPGSALDSVRRDSATTDTRSATSDTMSDTRSGTTMSTQTTPQSSDLNRESSQGMTADRDATSSRPMGATRSSAADDDFRMRNDRMARAPRADRN